MQRSVKMNVIYMCTRMCVMFIMQSQNFPSQVGLNVCLSHLTTFSKEHSLVSKLQYVLWRTSSNQFKLVENYVLSISNQSLARKAKGK